MMKDLESELFEFDVPPRLASPLDNIGRVGGPQLKMLQRLQIRKLRDALVDSGIVTLAAQAEALGLRRSTTWAILQANHKASGLSAATIDRMLKSPRLPPRARTAILEYVTEKAAGSYGASKIQCRKFAARLSIAQPSALDLGPKASRRPVDAGILSESSKSSNAAPKPRARLFGRRSGRIVFRD
jgi:hypothetical protein